MFCGPGLHLPVPGDTALTFIQLLVRLGLWSEAYSIFPASVMGSKEHVQPTKLYEKQPQQGVEDGSGRKGLVRGA